MVSVADWTGQFKTYATGEAFDTPWCAFRAVAGRAVACWSFLRTQGRTSLAHDKFGSPRRS